jgi:hypothetical protein
LFGAGFNIKRDKGSVMAIWDRFEDLVLEFMERRVSELLEQGDVTSPKVIANVRETAAWAAERAVARSDGECGGKLGERGAKSLNPGWYRLY